MKFEGEKAALREQKLREVIGEYHKKYFKELTTPPYQETNFSSVQEALRNLAHLIDEVLQGDMPERRDLIIALHYVLYLCETNVLLERCVLKGDYTTFYKKCSIESFLSTKRDNYDENSYKGLRVKL